MTMVISNPKSLKKIYAIWGQESEPTSNSFYNKSISISENLIVLFLNSKAGLKRAAICTEKNKLTHPH